MNVLDPTPEPKLARTAHEAAITALRVAPHGWQRAAEITGLLAAGCLIAAGMYPW